MCTVSNFTVSNPAVSNPTVPNVHGIESHGFDSYNIENQKIALRQFGARGRASKLQTPCYMLYWIFLVQLDVDHNEKQGS